MKYEGKLDAIAKHYNIKGFDKMNLNAKAEACKKAAGKPTVSEAYDHITGSKSSTTATVTAETPKKVEIIPPGGHASVAHQVDVAAPQINVNVPAPVVTVSHGDLTWSHVLRQGGLWLNGFVMGGTMVALGMVLMAMRAAP